MLDVSTIRVEGGVKVGSDLICTCPNPPPPPSSSSSSHSVIATAAILPPPPSFLCSDPPGHVQTVALAKVSRTREIFQFSKRKYFSSPPAPSLHLAS